MWYYPAQAAGNDYRIKTLQMVDFSKNLYFYLYLLNNKIVTALLLWVISVILPSGKVTLLLPLGLKALG